MPPYPNRSAPRAALVIAHPGHELRIHGWLEQLRPWVFVLTDGSGRTGRARLDSTTRLLRRAGAEPASIYGRFTDASLYTTLLQRDALPFVALVEELAAALIHAKVDYVAGDAIEGYNPGHDVCRFLIDGAVQRVQQLTGRWLGNYDFPLTGRPDACPEALRSRALRVRLDEAAFARKVQAARDYPEMAAEVETALRTVGAEAFRTEWLRPCHGSAELAEPPFYEGHGQDRVAAGCYPRVLRYREHILPLRWALERRNAA